MPKPTPITRLHRRGSIERRAHHSEGLRESRIARAGAMHKEDGRHAPDGIELRLRRQARTRCCSQGAAISESPTRTRAQRQNSPRLLVTLPPPGQWCGCSAAEGGSAIRKSSHHSLPVIFAPLSITPRDVWRRQAGRPRYVSRSERRRTVAHASSVPYRERLHYRGRAVADSRSCDRAGSRVQFWKNPRRRRRLADGGNYGYFCE